MPLSFLGELLDFATAEEKRKQEAKEREQLTKLWLAHYIIKRMAKETPMEYQEFIALSLRKAQPASTAAAARKGKQKTADEILTEFAPIIAADSKKE